MQFDVMVLELAKSFVNTFLIFVLTLLGAIPLGFIVYFLKKSKNRLVSKLIDFYISLMRGTPLILQLMVVFYGPSLLLNVVIKGNWRFNAVILAFVINYAAYFAEIYRGGIEAIDKGQYMAAKILGYNNTQTFFRIILPQMTKIVLPSMANEIITLVKDTSIAYAIGTVEMFTKAKQIAVAPKSPGMLTFVVAAIFYYIFNALVDYLLKRAEKALEY